MLKKLAACFPLAVAAAIFLSVPSLSDDQPSKIVTIAPKTSQEALRATSSLSKVETKAVELLPQMMPICACESVGSKYKQPTHYEKDGVTVLRGKINNQDVGICQINLRYHQKRATDMGLNLFKESDNIKYANWLFTKQGTTPWHWSKSCWQ